LLADCASTVPLFVNGRSNVKNVAAPLRLIVPALANEFAVPLVCVPPGPVMFRMPVG